MHYRYISLKYIFTKKKRFHDVCDKKLCVIARRKASPTNVPIATDSLLLAPIVCTTV